MHEIKINLLREFGFTQLEAMVYLTILQTPEQTGYRIAKKLGKPVPNTYKALGILENRGVAVCQHTDKSKKYSALPLDDYLNELKRDFEKKRNKVEEELKSFELSKETHTVVTLANVDEVYSKGNLMISNAKKIVIVEGFPRQLKRLKKNLENIASKGIKVFVKALEPIEIYGCNVSIAYTAMGTIEDLLYEVLNIVVDSKEFITAYFNSSTRRLIKAHYSKNKHLSYTIYSGLIQKICFTIAENRLQGPRSKEEIFREIQEIKKIFSHSLVELDSILDID